MKTTFEYNELSVTVSSEQPETAEVILRDSTENVCVAALLTKKQLLEYRLVIDNTLEIMIE